MNNPYDTLGVPPSATAAEIKAAWRKLASELHPDHGAGDAERMKAVNEAYETLSDPGKREEFDEAPDAATQLAVQHFIHAMTSFSEDVITTAKATLAHEKTNLQQARRQASAERGKLNKKLSAIKFHGKGKPWLLEVLTLRLDHIAKMLDDCAKQEIVLTDAMKVLDEYQDTSRKPETRPKPGYFLDDDFMPLR